MAKIWFLNDKMKLRRQDDFQKGTLLSPSLQNQRHWHIVESNHRYSGCISLLEFGLLWTCSRNWFYGAEHVQ